MGIHRISCDILPLSVYYVDTREEYDKLRSRHTDELSPLSPQCDGVSSDFEGGTLHIIAVFEKDKAVLVHETCHAAVKACLSLGIGITYENHETLAYLQSYLYKEIAFIMDNPT